MGDRCDARRNRQSNRSWQHPNRSAVIADLARLKVDAVHLAGVREILWARTYEQTRGYRARPWLKALEIHNQFDETHPLGQSKEDQLVAVYSIDRIEHTRQLAAKDPQGWWREFCAHRSLVPEDLL